MKKFAAMAVLGLAVLVAAPPVQGRGRQHDGGDRADASAQAPSGWQGDGGQAAARPQPPDNRGQRADRKAQPAPLSRALRVVRLSRPGNGGWNRAAAAATVPPRGGGAASPAVAGLGSHPFAEAPAAQRHPYTPGTVRQRLQALGVTHAPELIGDRAHLLMADRRHSQAPRPSRGPQGQALAAQAVSARHFNDPVVRDHMALVARADWGARLDGFDRDENHAGRYYWHRDGGMDYCHYLDSDGFHWYGFYTGSQCFWTRHYQNRWWWHDDDFDRWCFWNDGFWWWQDPYHLTELYCYNDNAYIPADSAEDPARVSSPPSDQRAYPSADNSRVVKVSTGTGDAFLYDTANPPAFEPVYLASGVTRVDYSNPAYGRPLQIILKLSDGSYDFFDAQGQAYSTQDGDR